MRINAEVDAPSKGARWTGRVLTGLMALFLLFDGVAKVMRVPQVMEVCAEMEVPAWVVPRLGVVLIAATLIHLTPATSTLGAILLTGYLGGATWTHVRLGGPVFPMLFPAIVGAVIWGGLLLREPRLRGLLPLSRTRRGERPAMASAREAAVEV